MEETKESDTKLKEKESNSRQLQMQHPENRQRGCCMICMSMVLLGVSQVLPKFKGVVR